MARTEKNNLKKKAKTKILNPMNQKEKKKMI